MVQNRHVNDFLNEATTQGVIIDVRTPAEYAKGHIPGARNLPLFTNDERVVVGTLYVRAGREKAIEKGLEFVGPRMADLVRQAKRIAKGSRVYLYCWRGGMRSASVAWLFSTAGLEVSLLIGGYKAYRRDFEEMLAHDAWSVVILSGSTGCGKTELLHHLAEMGEQVVDLEGLANHKGSAFGGIGQGDQPTTEHFINKLHHRFRQLTSDRIIWCEAESVLIGGVFIPPRLYEIMHSGTQIKIEMNREQRLDRIMNDYGAFAADDLIHSFQKIAKRFGPEQTKNAIQHIEKGEIREAAAMGLQYYDACYKKTEKETTQISLLVDNNNMKQSAIALKQLVCK